MKPYSTLKRLSVFFAAAALLVNSMATALTIKDADRAKIRQAMPDKPIVTAKQARKVLVFDLSKGYKHGSIPYCAVMLDVMAEKTGAFTVTHSEDMNVFRAENLKQYDAVIFNNTTRLQMNDPAQRQGLIDFVKSGKGVIGIHAATDNFYTFPEAADMMGGQFDGHPWVGGGTWAVKIDKPDHPLNKSFGGKGFKINEEIYRSKGFSRTKVQVLVGLDFSDETTANAKGRRATDKDNAISWIRNFGKGRVFYCSFGHQSHIYWNTAILTHYLAGIQFALGDYAIDATADVPRVLKEIARFKEGASRKALYELNGYIRNITGLPDEMKAYEQAILKTLAGPVTAEGRDALCRALSLIGSEASAKVLGGMLLDPKTSDVARYALERIEGNAVDALLISSMQKAPEAIKIGIINTLGVRKCDKAVTALSPLLSASGFVKEAAIEALAAIGSRSAVAALTAAEKQAEGFTKALIEDALIRVAENQLEAGNKAAAGEIFSSLSQSDNASIRCASLQGLIQTAPSAANALASALKDSDPSVVSMAIELSRQVEGSAMTAVLTGALGHVDPLYQVQILAALGDRKDRSALGTVVNAVKTAKDDVKTQAIRSLITLGNGSVIPMLAELAAKGESQYRNTAMDTLCRMPAADVNAAIVGLLNKSDDTTRVVLIRSLAIRKVTAAVPALLDQTSSSNSSVAAEAFKALKSVSTAAQLPQIIDRMVKATSSRVLDEAGVTIAALAEGDPTAVMDAYNRVSSSKIKAALLKIMGMIGSEKSLGVLRAALNGSDRQLTTEAIRALSSWSNAQPLGDLLKMSDNTSSKINQILAIRGSAALLEKDSSKSATDKVKLYKALMDKSDNGDTQKQILGHVGHVNHVAGLALALSYLENSNLQSEAAQAVITIAEKIGKKNANEAKSALNLVIAKVKNSNITKKANEVLKTIK